MEPLLAIVGDINIFSLDDVDGFAIFGFKKRQPTPIIPPHVSWLLALGCLLLPNLVRATTVVGIWTEKQVTIAADSKQTITQNGRLVGSQNACKIYPVHDLIFAFSGLAKSEEVDVIESIQNGHELKDMKTGKILPEMGPWVAAQMALQKILSARGEPVTVPPYNQTVSAGMIVAGRIEKKLVMYRIEIAITPPTPQAPGRPSFAMRRIAYPESRGYEGTDPKRGFEIIGITDAISRFRSLLPREWNSGSDVEVAKRLIAVEASDSIGDQFVGAPISIIIVNNSGIHWIDKGVCQWEPQNQTQRGK